MTHHLRSSRPRRGRLAWLLAGVALVLAACGSDAGSSSPTTAVETNAAPSDSGATDTTTPGSTAVTETTSVTPPSVPAGTELRVGDQSSTLQLPLEGSGEAAGLQSSVQYATFAAGPPLIEAFNAGALDLGYVGDTPPVLALARGQDIVIVGAWHFSGNVAAIVAPPGKSITSLADLKGKNFAYTSGTALQAFAIRALKEGGLTESDVNHVDVPILDVLGALQSGDVDAGVLVEPILSGYLAATPDATVVRDANGLTTGLQLLITTKKTLEDPAKAAAIGDFIYHQVRASQWIQANRDEYAQRYADANQITVEQALQIFDKNGSQPFVPIDDDVIGDLQELADVFLEAGAIPAQLDAHDLVDDRFNPYVELALGGG